MPLWPPGCLLCMVRRSFEFMRGFPVLESFRMANQRYWRYAFEREKRGDAKGGRAMNHGPVAIPAPGAPRRRCSMLSSSPVSGDRGVKVEYGVMIRLGRGVSARARAQPLPRTHCWDSVAQHAAARGVGARTYTVRPALFGLPAPLHRANEQAQPLAGAEQALTQLQ